MIGMGVYGIKSNKSNKTVSSTYKLKSYIQQHVKIANKPNK